MQKNKQAFTLIELLVVVLIIGILAAVALPQYQKAVTKARTIQALTTVKAVAQAQEAYYLAHGDYATEPSQMDIENPEIPQWNLNVNYYGEQIYMIPDNTVQYPEIHYYFDTKRLLCVCWEEDTTVCPICASLTGHSSEDCEGIDDYDPLECYYFN